MGKINWKIIWKWWPAWWWDMLSTNNLSDVADIETSRDNLDVYSKEEVNNWLDTKQDTLVSWTNIKTVNWDTLLWSWDLVVSAWTGWFAANLYPTVLTSTTEWTYNQLSYTADLLETLVTTDVSSWTWEVLVETYLFDLELWTTIIDWWVWDLVWYGSVSSSVWDTRMRLEFFTYETDTTENTLFSMTSEEIDNTSIELFKLESTQPSYAVNSTDKLWIRVYVSTNSVPTISVTYVVWDWRSSYFNTPLATRHSQLRGREEVDQHPIWAITDLQDELDSKLNLSWWSLTWALNQKQWTAIASATTTDIWAATWNSVNITWTTTITWLWTVQAWTQRTVTFDWALILTYNATSLILPTSADITTVAGDTADFISLWSWNWICTNYQRASWEALVWWGWWLTELFSAKKTTSQSLTTAHTTIILNNEIFDTWNNYNNTTWEYTIPSNWIYYFNIILRVSGLTDLDEVYSTLSVDWWITLPFIFFFRTGLPSIWFSTALQLNAWQKVSIKIRNTTDSRWSVFYSQLDWYKLN